MTIEVPVLRLGLAGFTPRQQQAAERDAGRRRGERRAPAGSSARLRGGGRLVARRRPHAVLHGRTSTCGCSRACRPGARCRSRWPKSTGRWPSRCRSPRRASSRGDLRPRRTDSAAAVLQPVRRLAADHARRSSPGLHIAEHQPSLGSGSWEVLRGSELLAVVDMQLAKRRAGVGDAGRIRGGELGIRDHGGALIPARLSRARALSQLMWQYAQRTQRDLLPPHYRTGLLYFRRAAAAAAAAAEGRAPADHARTGRSQPGTNFEGLQQRSGLGERAAGARTGRALLRGLDHVEPEARRAARHGGRDRGLDAPSAQLIARFDSCARRNCRRARASGARPHRARAAAARIDAARARARPAASRGCRRSRRCSCTARGRRAARLATTARTSVVDRVARPSPCAPSGASASRGVPAQAAAVAEATGPPAPGSTAAAPSSCPASSCCSAARTPRGCAAAADLAAQAVDRRADRGRVVREVVVDRDAVDVAAHFHAALDVAELAERRARPLGRHADVLGGARSPRAH